MFLKSACISEDSARQTRAGNLSLKVQVGDILYLSVQEKNSEDVFHYFLFPVLQIQSLCFCKRSPLPTWSGWFGGDEICIKV